MGCSGSRRLRKGWHNLGWSSARRLIASSSGREAVASRELVLLGFAFSDPAEFLELASEAALVRTAREHPRRDRREPSDRLEFLGDARSGPVRLEGCRGLASQ